MWSKVGLKKHHVDKASGGDGIQIDLFYPKRWYCLRAALNMAANFKDSTLVTGLEKFSFHYNTKESSNYHTIALISHASKVMLKILQVRLQKYVKQELPGVQAGFRKGEESEIKLSTPIGSYKK